MRPAALVGHSVGEVAACYLAGALSLRDAVLVSHHRSRLQAVTAGTGGMLAVGLPEAEALARLEEQLGDDLYLVTQNVDDLHERGGSQRVHHMHGRLRAAWCTACDRRHEWTGTLQDRPPCPVCGSTMLRPDVVWFGEMPYDMERIDDALQRADLFVSIGTSGAVYPAAGFVQTARYCGARTIEMNLEPTIGSTFFDDSRIGPAGELVPEWVEEMLGA